MLDLDIPVTKWTSAVLGLLFFANCGGRSSSRPVTKEEQRAQNVPSQHGAFEDMTPQIPGDAGSGKLSEGRKCFTDVVDVGDIELEQEDFSNGAGGIEIRDFSAAQDGCGNLYVGFSSPRGAFVFRQNASNGVSSRWRLRAETGDPWIGPFSGLATEQSGDVVVATATEAFVRGPFRSLQRIEHDLDEENLFLGHFVAPSGGDVFFGSPGLASLPGGSGRLTVIDENFGSDLELQHRGAFVSEREYLDATPRRTANFSSTYYVVERVSIIDGKAEREELARLFPPTDFLGRPGLRLAASDAAVVAVMFAHDASDEVCQTSLGWVQGEEPLARISGCKIPQAMRFNEDGDVFAAFLELSPERTEAELTVELLTAGTTKSQQIFRQNIGGGGLGFVQRDLQIAQLITIPQMQVAFIDAKDKKVRVSAVEEE